MARDEKNYPQAFPVPAGSFPEDDPCGNSYGHGMSLRDYFAAASILMCTQNYAGSTWLEEGHGSLDLEGSQGLDIAEECYFMADALLKARKK